jgi:hypothetical protein
VTAGLIHPQHRPRLCGGGALTTWFRQHRESLLYRMPWHIEDPAPTRAAMLGLRLAFCGTTMAAEDRGIDRTEDPPLDDRCPSCQAIYSRGEAG